MSSDRRPTHALATPPRRPDGPPRERGFTLLELVVAMGLLSGFMLMLVRLLSTGVGLFDEGERGQELLDRAQAAARAVRSALQDTCGPRLIGRPTGEPDARLLVTFAPLGGVDGGPRMPQLRSTERLDVELEEELLTAAFAQIARADGLDEFEVEDAVRERLATWPRSGRGELLFLPWPTDQDGVFLELRRGDRPADPMLFPADEPTLLEFAAREELELTPERVLATTRVVARGLLHFEMAFWSQRTLGWAAAGASGPEVSWDSARAGLTVGETQSPEDFGLDLGPFSLRDLRDDVWPRWIRVTLVVGGSSAAPPESYLVQPLTAGETTFVVTRPDDLPDPVDSPWLKVGPEWVRFQGVSGRTVTGVRRGGRGTAAVAHPVGTGIRAGREVVFYLPIAHGRDADD